MSAALAARADPQNAVTMVLVFAGPGAPHWDAGARGAIFGLTRGAGPAELARAALESICSQTVDPVAAMRAGGAAPEGLRIDGGMARNRRFAQRLADLLAFPSSAPARPRRRPSAPPSSPALAPARWTASRSPAAGARRSASRPGSTRTRSDGGAANMRTDEPPPVALSARYPSGGSGQNESTDAPRQPDNCARSQVW